MDNRDFRNDRKDAGEIGAGCDTVMMVELTLNEGYTAQDALFTVRLRYKDPGQTKARELTKSVKASVLEQPASADFNFASSVVIFGHLLRNSRYTDNATIAAALQLAQKNLGSDPGGYRAEFVKLLKTYQGIGSSGSDGWD